MKNLLFGLFATVLLVSCNSSATTEETKTTQDSTTTTTVTTPSVDSAKVDTAHTKGH